MTQSRAEQPRNQLGLAQICRTSKLKASNNDIQSSLLSLINEMLRFYMQMYLKLQYVLHCLYWEYIVHLKITPGNDCRSSVDNVFVINESYINMMQLLQKGNQSTQCKKKDFKGTQRTNHVCLCQYTYSLLESITRMLWSLSYCL